MNNAKYEKPALKFVELHNQQAVAALDGPCMPQAAQRSNKFYYDVPGDGWLEIITPTNCSGKHYTIKYVDNTKILGQATDEVKAKAMADAEESLNYDKQAFAGAVVGEPKPSWS
ncbi:MAG TPA: hypothetical protein DCM43_00710 [Lachnospiraceae bacterium]|nr:hypothetical protein [Lachnospiraceae bacterium]